MKKTQDHPCTFIFFLLKKQPNLKKKDKIQKGNKNEAKLLSLRGRIKIMAKREKEIDERQNGEGRENEREISYEVSRNWITSGRYCLRCQTTMSAPVVRRTKPPHKVRDFFCRPAMLQFKTRIMNRDVVTARYRVACASSVFGHALIRG